MRRVSARPTVAVVGGGVAGAATAIALARTAAAPDVVLLDRSGTFARGVAYGTDSETHLLNVTAGRMSLFADDPEHFLRWARGRLATGVAADAFLPRKLYGDYVAETLTAASVRDDRRVIRTVSAAAIDVEPGVPAVVRCADGARIAATHVVLALGNDAPADPPLEHDASFYASPRYTTNPWGRDALASIAADDAVLLIGSGLTMYDVVLMLRARGHRGAIHVVSRRGLLPSAHAPVPSAVPPGPAPEDWLTVAPKLSALLRAVRRACAQAEDWRSVVDSLRSVTGTLWQRLDARERERFLTRVRPFWDAHRHRAPIEVDRRIATLLAAGTVRRHTARLRRWGEDANGVTAVLDRGTIRIDRVVNCTGPSTDVHRSTDPLVRSLLRRGLVVRDAHGLGVETAADGALVDVAGRTSSSLFTLGTWRRPAHWESVAVPELRAQAVALACRLTRERPGPAAMRDPRELTHRAQEALRARPPREEDRTADDGR